MATSPSALSADLDQMVADLHDEYGHRRAHGGRLTQIAAHVETLKSLVEQLPDEEAREADYESRLMTLHEAGYLDPDNDKHCEQHPAVARDIVREALARKAAGQ